MKFPGLILLALTAGSAPVAAQPTQTYRDCSERRMVPEPFVQHFGVDETGASWSVYLDGGIILSATALLLGDEARRALDERGMLDPDLGTGFGLSTTDGTLNAESIELRAGSQALPSVPYVRDRFDMLATQIPAA